MTRNQQDNLWLTVGFVGAVLLIVGACTALGLVIEWCVAP